MSICLAGFEVKVPFGYDYVLQGCEATEDAEITRATGV